MSEIIMPIRRASPPPPQRSALVLVAEFMSSIGTIWTFGLMLLVVADVVGRSFFRLPITGVAEIAGNSIVAIVFLQLSAAIAAGRMTRADFLLGRMRETRPAVARLIDSLFALIGAAVMALVAYASWPGFVDSYQSAEYFGVQGTFTVLTWPFRGVIVIGAVLAAIMYARAAIIDLRHRAARH